MYKILAIAGVIFTGAYLFTHSHIFYVQGIDNRVFMSYCITPSGVLR